MQWAELVRAMMVETEWRMSGRVPSMEEYMRVALPSIAVGPVLCSSLYLVGPELPDDVVRGHEYSELLRHTNICSRLKNDLATYERENAQGKVNSVPLLARRRGGSIEAAEREVKGTVEASRRKLLRLVARKEGAVPRPCRAILGHLQGRPPVILQGGGWLHLAHGAGACRERGGAGPAAATCRDDRPDGRVHQ